MTGTSMRNVTLSVPEDLLKRVKIAAAQRGTSMSALMVHALANVVGRDLAYETRGAAAPRS